MPEHCAVCHQTFSGTAAGDMHQVGKCHIRTGPDRMRCLSVDEMLALGMAQNARGIWMTPSAEWRAARMAHSGPAVST